MGSSMPNMCLGTNGKMYSYQISRIEYIKAKTNHSSQDLLLLCITQNYYIICRMALLGIG